MKTYPVLAGVALGVLLGACAHTDGTRGMASADASSMQSDASATASTGTSPMSADTLAGTGMAADPMAGHAGHDMTAAGMAMMVDSPTEALALLAAVDESEIRLAQQAMSKGVSGPVLDYARRMQADHTPHLAKVQGMLTAMGGMPASSAALQKMKASGQVAETNLAGVSGDLYARAYMDQMVLGHQHALALVDASMKVATAADTRDFLMKTQQTLKTHLQLAQAVRAQLGR